MELFGVPLETFYLYALIVSAALTILYLFFGDIIELGLDGLLNPVLFLSFITIFSAGGYIGERYTIFHSGWIIVVNVILALILVTLLHFFVLVPFSKAEESLVYNEQDLIGRTGTIITTVPKDGFGEVLIESSSGRIAKPAVSFRNNEISNGKKVLIINVEKGVLKVELYDETGNIF